MSASLLACSPVCSSNVGHGAAPARHISTLWPSAAGLLPTWWPVPHDGHLGSHSRAGPGSGGQLWAASNDGLLASLPQSAGLALYVQLKAQEVGLGSQQWPAAGLIAPKCWSCSVCAAPVLPAMAFNLSEVLYFALSQECRSSGLYLYQEPACWQCCRQ